MIYALAYVIFIVPFTAWLRLELGCQVSLKTYWPWIAGAAFIGIAGPLLGNELSDIAGNFVLHASGGIASTLLFIYMIKTLQLDFSWVLSAILLLAFVCTLGVLNELLEYVLELLSVALFSIDTHDTWRDLVANTTGAALAWFTYSLIIAVRPRRK